MLTELTRSLLSVTRTLQDYIFSLELCCLLKTALVLREHTLNILVLYGDGLSLGSCSNYSIVHAS